MKKLVALLAIWVVLLLFASCGAEPEEPLCGPPGDLVPSDTTPAPTAPSVTSSRDDVPPLTNHVELVNGEGDPLEMYSEVVCVHDGSMVGDGHLMFCSVPTRLSQISGEIPAVDLGDAPTLLVTIKSWETVSGGDKVSIYGEDYTLLADDVPLSEVPVRGRGEWQGRTVYLYFSVTYNSNYRPEYHKSQTTAYFIKTSFPQP